MLTKRKSRHLKAPAPDGTVDVRPAAAGHTGVVHDGVATDLPPTPPVEQAAPDLTAAPVEPPEPPPDPALLTARIRLASWFADTEADLAATAAAHFCAAAVVHLDPTTLALGEPDGPPATFAVSGRVAIGTTDRLELDLVLVDSVVHYSFQGSAVDDPMAWRAGLALLALHGEHDSPLCAARRGDR